MFIKIRKKYLLTWNISIVKVLKIACLEWKTGVLYCKCNGFGENRMGDATEEASLRPPKLLTLATTLLIFASLMYICHILACIWNIHNIKMQFYV